MPETNEYYDTKKEVLVSVCDRLIKYPGANDDTVMSVIRECIVANRKCGKLSPKMRGRMSHELFNRIRRLDVLQDLLEDDTITEIMVNGTDEIFVEREGRLMGTDVRFESRERLADIIGKIAAGVNRTINLSSPILDARLADGSRVNAVLDPVAIDGPALTIRRFPKSPIDAKWLVERNCVTREVLDLLKDLVAAGYNILISGANRIIGLSQMTFRKQRVQTT